MSKRKTLLASEMPVFEEEHEVIDDVAEKRRRASGSSTTYIILSIPELKGSERRSSPFL